MGIREQRKKIQRSILFLAETPNRELVLKELKMIHQLLIGLIHLMEPNHAPVAATPATEAVEEDSSILEEATS